MLKRIDLLFVSKDQV